MKILIILVKFLEEKFNHQEAKTDSQFNRIDEKFNRINKSNVVIIKIFEWNNPLTIGIFIAILGAVLKYLFSP